jgi:hypothetical protein
VFAPTGAEAWKALSRSEVFTALKRTVHLSFPAVGTIESMDAFEPFDGAAATNLLRLLAGCACRRRLGATTVERR